MELRNLGLIGASVGVAVSLLAMSGGVAGATAGPTVSVHFYQNTSVDGQQVGVVGKNFLASQPLIAVTECSAGVAGGDMGACSQTPGTGKGMVYLTSSNATGQVTMNMVHNSYYISTGAVGDGTCNVGQTCFIAVAVLNPQNPFGPPLQYALAPFVVHQ